MIEYITHLNLNTIIYKTDKTEILSKSVLSIINKICMDELTTYDGYKKAIKHKFNYQYKIPLYLNDNIQLIPIERVRNYANIWVNYAAIKDVKIESGIIRLVFISGRNLDLFIKPKILSKQVERLNQIRLFRSKHFHV